MFPFQMSNGFINGQFPFNMCYQMFQPSLSGVNPYILPYSYPNYSFAHQNPVPNYPLGISDMYLLENNQNAIKPQIYRVQRKKKIVKKLSLIQIKKNFSNMGKQFKHKKKTLKYFDPSRAPPISSLRNKQELELDLKQQQLKHSNLQTIRPINQQKNNFDRDVLKLQLLLRQPNICDYPFLICKKRKYYRNLKRRYSVAYFEQRASYINKKMPIPSELHPKNKVRKSRFSSKNTGESIIQDSDSSGAQMSESVYCSQYQSKEMISQQDQVVENSCDDSSLKQAIKKQKLNQNHRKKSS